MPNATKLPALDTFDDVSQLANLRALRQTVLKNRSGFFATMSDSNAWIQAADQRLAALEAARKVSPVPVLMAGGGSPAMTGRPQGAEIGSHFKAREVSPIARTDGQPHVKVVSDPNRSMRANPRQATQQEPMMQVKVKTPTTARPALARGPGVMREAAPALVHSPATGPVVTALPLLHAIDLKHRHAAMASDIFGMLKQAALDARHGNSDHAAELIQKAEDLEHTLVSELEQLGPLSVIRPPSLAQTQLPPPDGQSQASDAQSGA